MSDRYNHPSYTTNDAYTYWGGSGHYSSGYPNSVSATHYPPSHPTYSSLQIHGGSHRVQPPSTMSYDGMVNQTPGTNPQGVYPPGNRIPQYGGDANAEPLSSMAMSQQSGYLASGYDGMSTAHPTGRLHAHPQMQTHPHSRSQVPAHSMAAPFPVPQASARHPSLMPDLHQAQYAAQNTYAQSSSLEQYPASPQRPFSCDMCALSFNRMHDLKRHRDTHTGEKPFLCNGGCGKTFTRKDALKRHQLVKQCGIDEGV